MNDNGTPAFPGKKEVRNSVGAVVREEYATGMTLREYFAGQAVAGWMATFTDNTDGSDVNADGIARFAYRIADAMLKARGG